MTSPFLQALSAALLHFIWEGMAVGLLLWITLLLLRNRSANARYTASCLALSVLAILPVVTLWLVYPKAVPVSPTQALTITTPAGAVSVATAIPPMPVNWLDHVEQWTLPIWSLGVLLLSVRLAWGAAQVYRLRRAGTAADSAILARIGELAARLGITRRVNVLISSLADGPTVVGWLRPVVLLPSAALLGLTTEQLEAVLAHELAHIRRHDYLVNVLQMLVETALFYHPVVWWASARIRRERELCCDDVAVAACGGDALCYARALTTLERMRIATPAMAMASTGNALRYRILRLVGAARDEQASSRLAGVIALCVGLACFAATTHWAHGQPQQRPVPAPVHNEQVEARHYVFVTDTRHQEAEHGIVVETDGAQLLHRNPAEYPQGALAKKIQGTVIVEATLDATGNVEDARVISGPVELRNAALRSALSAHFVNRTEGSTRQLRFTFTPTAVQARDDSSSLSDQLQEEIARQNKLAAEREQAAALKNLFQQANMQLAAVQTADGDMREDRVKRLKMAIATLEESMAAARRNYRPDMPEVVNLQSQLNFAKQKLQEAEASQAQSRAEHADQAKLELEQRVLALRKELETIEKARLNTDVPQNGPIIREVSIIGLPDDLKQQLLLKLAIQPGQALTTDTVRRLKTTVREFDEHLDVKFTAQGDGQINVVVSAPGSNNNLIIHYYGFPQKGDKQ